ncbi:hypothetical protein BH09VER1_BH09VER1_21300 [soil metagenome]
MAKNGERDGVLQGFLQASYYPVKIIYDPVQAIFDGIASTFARMFLAVAAFLLAYGTYFISQGEHDLRLLSLFPLVAFAVIFAWATKGLLFFLGLAVILSFFVVAYQFLNTTEPKALFMVLYVLGFIYFLPLMWDKEFVVWKALATAFGLLILYIFAAYIAPWAANLLFNRNEENGSDS